MITRSSDGTNFVEINDENVLVEVGSERPTIYLRENKEIEWQHSTYGNSTSVESLKGNSVTHGDREITGEEAISLLENGRVTEEKPVRIENSRIFPGNINAEKMASSKPKLYDKQNNELSVDGVKIPQLDKFVSEHNEKTTINFLDELFEQIYDPEGFNLIHSTDYRPNLKAENTDIEEYDENVIKALESRGHAFCGELEKLVTYTLRNKGVNSMRMPGNYALRYDENTEGITIPDSKGDRIVEHGFNYFQNEDQFEKIDPSIYLHLREAGMNHEESFKYSRNRDEVYLLENNLTAPIGEEDKLVQTLEHVEVK